MRTYNRMKVHIISTPALIKLNAPGNVTNVFVYTKVYSGADPSGDSASIDEVIANIFPKQYL